MYWSLTLKTKRSRASGLRAIQRSRSAWSVGSSAPLASAIARRAVSGLPTASSAVRLAHGGERGRELAHAVAEASDHLEREHGHLRIERMDHRVLDALLGLAEPLRIDAFGLVIGDGREKSGDQRAELDRYGARERRGSCLNQLERSDQQEVTRRIVAALEQRRAVDESARGTERGGEAGGTEHGRDQELDALDAERPGHVAHLIGASAGVRRERRCAERARIERVGGVEHVAGLVAGAC